MAVETIAELFRDTAFGEALVQQGLEQGLERGREQLLTVLLQERFGSHPRIPAVARRLTGWPDASSAVHAITVAASVDDLSTAPPPA